MVLILGIGDGVDLAAHPGRRETQTVDDKRGEGELPVGRGGHDLGKDNRGSNDKYPANAHDELGADVLEQPGDSVETNNKTDTVDNVGQSSVDGSVVEDVLGGKRGVKDHGVVGGGDTDDDNDRGSETTGLPDAEGHDGVLDSELPPDKGSEDDKADQEGSQGLGRTPTGSVGFAQVEDNGNNAQHEQEDTEKVDAAVGRSGVVVDLGDNKEASNGQ